MLLGIAGILSKCRVGLQGGCKLCLPAHLDVIYVWLHYYVFCAVSFYVLLHISKTCHPKSLDTENCPLQELYRWDFSFPYRKGLNGKHWKRLGCIFSLFPELHDSTFQ